MNPQILHIYGPFAITSYGLFLALGLLCFLTAAFFHPTRRRYIGSEQFLDTAAAGIFGGLFGGKILFLLHQKIVHFNSWSELVEVLLGGFAILGAIIGALIGIIAYLYWQQLAIREVLDIGGAYALLAHGIARWGCFFAGCCYGAVCGQSWLSVIYTHPDSFAPLKVSLYPTQVMMSLASLAGFFLIRFIIYPWRGRARGSVVAWYIFWESMSRFVIDFWRGDRELAAVPLGQHSFWWPLSSYQYIAIMIMLGALVAVVLLHLYEQRRWR